VDLAGPEDGEWGGERRAVGRRGARGGWWEGSPPICPPVAGGRRRSRESLPPVAGGRRDRERRRLPSRILFPASGVVERAPGDGCGKAAERLARGYPNIHVGLPGAVVPRE
jgi:hypothetical protein